jgi:hypothetical protein
MYTIHFDTTNTRTPGKLADVELRFTDDAGPLAGLRLIGFGIWQRRYSSGAAAYGRYNVTMPARQYAVNGERRSYALLRPQAGSDATNDGIRDAIIAAWRAQQNPEPYSPATVPTTYDTAPAPVPKEPRTVHAMGDQTLGVAATPQPAPPTTMSAETAAQCGRRTRFDWPCDLAAGHRGHHLSSHKRDPLIPASVPTTYDTAPAPEPVQRYDNPDDAARAAQAGTPINILDLIRQADHTNASETREHHRPTVRPAMSQPKPKPGYTPAGDLIGF